jgi:hypothetical protein
MEECCLIVPYPEEGDSRLPRNLGICLTYYNASLSTTLIALLLSLLYLLISSSSPLFLPPFSPHYCLLVILFLLHKLTILL